MENNVALIYRGSEPHPAHAGFAEAIGAQIIGLNTISINNVHTTIPGEIINGILLDDYDIIIAEGTRVLYGIFANQIVQDTTLIYLGCDQGLYKLISEDYELDIGINWLIKKFGVRMLIKLFQKYVDGAIVISKVTENYVKEFLAPDTPVRISPPYIQTDVYDELGEVKPSLERKTVVTVGESNNYKGVDLIVDTWPQVRKEYSEASLKIVGKGHPEKYEATNGIEVLGFVESLSEVYNQASLYVQPSRIDGFAVTVVEAMRAGLPPIVTSMTGSKVEVARLGESLISEPQPEMLATSIINYFRLSLGKKQSISSQSRSIATKYEENIKKQEFKDSYIDILRHME
jgi:glycosyltransferase involved in cell wall biosynthesis